MQYSIIVPVYNVEEYLPCLLHSLIPQISESCQIILVDDGSTDRSGVLCDQFADSCSQIEVIHQKNGGVAAARNAGLMVAHGEYLLWADPDDLVAPDWFFQINQILSQGRPDILQFDYIELEGEKRNPRCYDRNDGYIDKEVYLRDVVRDVRVNSALWCRAFHRSLFEGMHFDETLRVDSISTYGILPRWLDGILYKGNVCCPSCGCKEDAHMEQNPHQGVVEGKKGFGCPKSVDYTPNFATVTGLD